MYEWHRTTDDDDSEQMCNQNKYDTIPAYRDTRLKTTDGQTCTGESKAIGWKSMITDGTECRPRSGPKSWHMCLALATLAVRLQTSPLTLQLNSWLASVRRCIPSAGDKEPCFTFSTTTAVSQLNSER